MDSRLLEVRRDVVLNPVRAKMMDALEAWTWNSFRARAGREAGHPCLTTAVQRDKGKRNRKIAEVIEKYGYTQRALEDHLGMHVTYISQVMNRSECKQYRPDPQRSDAETASI